MIGIVGGGISGLSLSHRLEAAGVGHLLLEASSRVGGVIRSSVVEGNVLDHGPQRTRVSGEVDALIRFAGLSDRLRALSPGLPLYVYRHGGLRRVPFSPGELLRTDALSASGKLRLLLEPFSTGPGPDETVGGYLMRRFGAEAYRSVLGPLFGGLYGSDPEHMFVRHALASLLPKGSRGGSLLLPFLRGAVGRSRAVPAVSFPEGMEELPRALHQRLQHRIRLETPVTKISQRSDGWTLETPAGSWEVSHLVLTGGAFEMARLLEGPAPEVSGRLARLVYNELLVVHLLGGEDLPGLGYQVAYDEPLRTRGVTWNAGALARPGLYTAFLGGARDPTAVSMTDGQLGELAREEFRRVTDLDTRPLGVTRTRIPAWDRSWTALDGLTLPPRLHLLTNFTGRVGIPGRVAEGRALGERLAEARD